MTRDEVLSLPQVWTRDLHPGYTVCLAEVLGPANTREGDIMVRRNGVAEFTFGYLCFATEAEAIQVARGNAKLLAQIHRDGLAECEAFLRRHPEPATEPRTAGDIDCEFRPHPDHARLEPAGVAVDGPAFHGPVL